MPPLANFEREKGELQALLASGVFDRAPNLSHLLNYICSKYFEGQAEQIKEYNLAVEALGRSPSFDQKRDSIVRVVAHLLRKRLREYYTNGGASHPVRIVIPLGQYAPTFVFQESLQSAPSEAPAPPPPTPPRTLVAATALSVKQATADVAGRSGRWSWFLLAALIAVAIVAVLPWGSGLFGRKSAIAAIRNSTASLPQNREGIHFLAGAVDADLLDDPGRMWSVDRYYDGGTASRTGHRSILGAADPLAYQSCRQGAFNYEMPLKPGV